MNPLYLNLIICSSMILLGYGGVLIGRRLKKRGDSDHKKFMKQFDGEIKMYEDEKEMYN